MPPCPPAPSVRDTQPRTELRRATGRFQIKALKKKIRQVEELEVKVAGGGVVPTEEQRQKLDRKPGLLAELAEVSGSLRRF